jgi:hypothetical protein
MSQPPPYIPRRHADKGTNRGWKGDWLPVLNMDMGACRATGLKVILSKWLEHVHRLTLKLSLAKAGAACTPILVDPPALPGPACTFKMLSTGYVFR